MSGNRDRITVMAARTESVIPWVKYGVSKFCLVDVKNTKFLPWPPVGLWLVDTTQTTITRSWILIDLHTSIFFLNFFNNCSKNSDKQNRDTAAEMHLGSRTMTVPVAGLMSAWHRAIMYRKEQSEMVHLGQNYTARHSISLLDEWPRVLIRTLGTHSPSLFSGTKLILQARQQRGARLLH